MEAMKNCSLCKINKPLSCFTNLKKSKDGKLYNCKECKNGKRIIEYTRCAGCGCNKIKNKSLNCYSCSNKVNRRNTKDRKPINGKGYKLITLPDHPLAYPKTKYYLEHRYVMEQQLGRYLEEHETVHHKNGDRSDNRIENLELWSHSQPYGQRVEDKIKWAEEILRKYKK